MALVKPFRYTTTADVQRRLHQTFVKYQGRSFYIFNCMADLSVNGWFMTDPEWKYNPNDPNGGVFENVHSSDVDLDLESPPLGWTNIKIGRSPNPRPLFFMRTVHRQFQQGISPGRAQYLDPYEDLEIMSGFRVGDWNDLIPFAKMIENIGYPSLIEASNNPSGAAFNKHWAVVPPDLKGKSFKTLKVYHDGIMVGLYSKPDKEFYFARMMLTKTRRASIEEILESPQNNGVYHAVKEQN